MNKDLSPHFHEFRVVKKEEKPKTKKKVRIENFTFDESLKNLIIEALTSNQENLTIHQICDRVRGKYPHQQQIGKLQVFIYLLLISLIVSKFLISFSLSLFFF